MTDASTRASVVAVLNGISNIGNVYDYARWSPSLTKYLGLFKTTIGGRPQVRGWMVNSEGIAISRVSLGGYRRVYNFRIRGYLSLDDSEDTENTFVALVEAIVNGLNSTLDTGVNTFPRLSEPAQCETMSWVLFGDVLCHYAEITAPMAELSGIS